MTTTKLQKEDICAVVVTYHPDAGFSDRMASIAGQVDRVVVVDNGSGDLAVSALREASSRLGAHLISNDENVGIATALNQGVYWAIEQGYRWALLFDQDTVPVNSMIEDLANIYDGFEPRSKLAVIGSNYSDLNTQRVAFEPRPSEARSSWVEKEFVITSGSLLSLAAFEVVGPFRDELFIDLADVEYCLRARSMGFVVVLTSKPIMKHALGAASVHRLPWKNTVVSNHSASRRYYMTRNYAVLACEYLFKEPRWVYSTSSWLIKSSILMMLFEGQRASKLRHVLLGIGHGLAGKLGKR